MTPVCPACRGQLAIDAFRCPRCGLAVRPTCSECGEPLTPSVDACWRCEARLDEAPLLAAPLPAPSATAVLEAPAYVARDTPVGPRQRHRIRRFVVTPLALALCVVLALLAYETFRPRFAEPVLMHERSIGNEFAVDVPARWEVTVDPSAVVFDDPDQPDGARGMRVVRMKDSLADARKQLTAIDRDLVPSYRSLRVPINTTVGGHAAFRSVFAGDGSVVEQWFVQHGKGTLRIDLYARPDLADDMRALDEHIITTFREL